MAIHNQRLKERRQRLDIPRSRLSNLCDISEARIRAYEDGVGDIPATDLAVLARALSVSADWLLGLTDDVDPSVAKKLSDVEIMAVKLIRRKEPKRHRDILRILNLL